MVQTSELASSVRHDGLDLEELDRILQLVGDRAAVIHPSRALGGPDGGGDIDCVVEHLDPMWPLRLRDGWQLCQRVRYDVSASSWMLERDGDVIAIDTLEDPEGLGQYGLSTSLLLPDEDMVVDAAPRAAYLTSKRLRKGIRDPGEWERIAALAATDPVTYTSLIREAFGVAAGSSLAARVLAGDTFIEDWDAVRRRQRRHRLRDGARAGRIVVGQFLRTSDRLLHPTGFYVLLVGPDGAGKSTLAGKLPGALEGLFRRNVHLHWRPGLLPRPGALLGREISDATEPHALRPHGRAASLALAMYHWADFALGGWVRVQSSRVRSGLIIVERGWWDIAVDPRRYRLRVSPAVIRVLGTVLPKPDLVVVLEGKPEALHARKSELPVGELARQMQGWRSAVPNRVRTMRVDVSEGSDAVAASVRRSIASMLEQRAMRNVGAGWVSFPSRSQARWILPRGSRATAVAALSVYQPVTKLGRIGWSLARTSASLGAFRLTPRSAPDPKVRSALAEFLPPGATVAIGRSHRSGRSVALVLRDGRPFAIAKIATGKASRASLAHEASAYAEIASRLEAPLRAPALLARSDDVLLFEFIDWRVRKRPEFLPADVASGVGAFFRSVDAHGATGLGHGDLAPWNVMRTEDGWAIVDWEEATSDTLPFGDIFHYLVQAHALLGSPQAPELLRGLKGVGWIGASLHAYAEAADQPISEVEDRFVDYLETSLARAIPDAGDASTGIRARRSLLRALRS